MILFFEALNNKYVETHVVLFGSLRTVSIRPHYIKSFLANHSIPPEIGQYLTSRPYSNKSTVTWFTPDRLAPNVDVGVVEHLFHHTFHHVRAVERREFYLELQIPSDCLRLSILFNIIQKIQADGLIEQFSVSQTTLEHVFVSMAQDQL